MRPAEFAGMSRYGVSAMECVWPLKLQWTRLSGNAPVVLLRPFTSSTFCAAGIVVVSPQNEAGGVLPPPLVGVGVGLAEVGGGGGGVVPPMPLCTWNSHSEYPHWVARAVTFIRM